MMTHVTQVCCNMQHILTIY